MTDFGPDRWDTQIRNYHCVILSLLLVFAVYVVFTFGSASLTTASLPNSSFPNTVPRRLENRNISYLEAEPTNMLERTELVRKRCKELQVHQDHNNITKDDIPRKLLVSERYQLIGCKAAKVAGTNLQRIFYVLDRFTNNIDTGQVKKKDAREKTKALFLNGTLEEMKYRLANYKKFMLVRHPLERLVSAYRDSKPLQLFSTNKRPSFRKYVVDVLQTANLTRPAVPVSKLCKPCLVKYDFVGSLNSFDQDMEEILTEVGAKDSVTIPRRNETDYTQDKSSIVVWDYYKEIPPTLIEQIEKYFEMDYFLFGFSNFREFFEKYKNSSESELYQWNMTSTK